MQPLSIILVTYNSAAVLPGCLASIPDGNQIIVVDNNSTDASVELAQAHGAEVIVNAENRGFGTGCNIGARRAQHECILFLNPDARLKPGALEALVAGLEAYPEAGAFSLKIVNAAGNHFFRKRSVLYTTWPWARTAIPTADTPIKNASGAALAFRKRVFDQIGGFDEAIFLYFEDDDISLRVRQSGRQIMYLNEAVVEHAIGTSSPLTPAMLDFKEYNYAKAMRYICAKHNRPLFLWYRRLKSRLQLIRAQARGDEMTAVALRAKLRAFSE